MALMFLLGNKVFGRKLFLRDGFHDKEVRKKTLKLNYVCVDERY